jgi:hypothetical protein
MFLIVTFSTLLLIIPNFLFIRRSNRKKRYGIFPGRISIGMTILLLIMWGIIHFSFHGTTQPTLGTFAKGSHAVERYQDARSQYERDQEEDEERLQSLSPYFSVGLLVLKVQFFIAVSCIIFALATVSGRNRFYYVCLFLHVVGLVLAFMIDRGL